MTCNYWLQIHEEEEERARAGQRRYDPFGAVSITAALLVFVYAISQAPQVGWAAPQTVAMLAVGVALLVLFLVIETRAAAPLPLLRRSAAAGILWAAQVPAVGTFWPNLAGPIVIAGTGTAFAFIPVSIGALAGVRERDAGVASGLLNTSQNLGGAIGVAVASSIAASHSRALLHHGDAAAAALTGGFQWALWVCGLTGLAAIPAAFVLIRRTRGPGMES